MMDKYRMTHTTLRLLRLYAVDYRLRLHVREAGRRIGADMTAARLQLGRLEEIGILRSSREGRNLAYSLNLGNPVARNYLVMSEYYTAAEYMGRNHLAKRALEDLDEHTDGAVVLFGSYAREEHDEKSDMDLLVMGRRAPDKKAVQRLSLTTGVRFDVKHETQARFAGMLRRNSPLAGEILANHITLKGADEFCRAAWKKYAEG